MPVTYNYEYKSTESSSNPQGSSSRTVHTTPSGTTVSSTQQPAGGQASTQTQHYPAGGSQGSEPRRLSREEAERRYLEAMEDEYAKREGVVDCLSCSWEDRGSWDG
ncbi:hypothetical protein TWF706_002692 [Orbilia oligospora]|uniref:Uncharacterized protein n=1 Tax=Orbilia oligospora TaxID=2813651 RepID=A0A7C8JVG7_ORBOL|nr:hypothetical protein TWF706_002692 [Orbilia oligospora]KAF3128395.1 hypothetical protein TWF703_009631 [Orbilia oligospora]